MNNLEKVLKKQGIIRCPKCNKDLDWITYSCNRLEYGTANLLSGEHEFSSNGDTDNYEYECPHCKTDITHLANKHL